VSASKQNLPLFLMTAILMASFLVWVEAIKGDSTLRIVLASVGFIGFAGLQVALLVARKRAAAES